MQSLNNSKYIFLFLVHHYNKEQIAFFIHIIILLIDSRYPIVGNYLF